jgi:DNA-binding winged helix-turn-helix (wHTH) protein
MKGNQMMASRRSWGSYALTYRAKEVAIIADWITASTSGTVTGLPGAGKSNLLGFLCHRPDALQTYLPPGIDSVAMIPIDLNNLPSNTLATLYRVILRSFYEVRDRFDQDLQQAIAHVYQENRSARDPFLPQSGLRELLLQLQAQQVRVVLVLDHFDRFGQVATPQMMDTLRGLRDSFKDTLCYIVSTRHELVYLPDPAALGEMYEVLDTHVCWVGPMSESDARQLIAEETHAALTSPEENEVNCLLGLTGGYPALLKAACHWWLDKEDRPEVFEWLPALLAERSVRFRLDEIWAGLTQEEKQVLTTVQSQVPKVVEQHLPTLARLATKGLCQETEKGWCIFSDLFAAYTTEVQRQSSGKIWLDHKTNELYQDKLPLDNLSPLERSVLHFLVTHPQTRHTKTDLIVNTWPEELRRQGVTDDSLYQVIMELRKKIEPEPAKPCYLVTWRGRPEGGYRFFPEGRPA